MARSWDRAIVVGASSGIGEAVARQLAGEGTQVALVARRVDRLKRICAEINEAQGAVLATPFAHDVAKTEGTAALFQEITTRLGGLDLVVYAAGIMPPREFGEFPTQSDLEVIKTNFAGAVAWLNEAATRFARARSGTIIGVSSVAGDRGRTKNPIYHATKAALDTYLESLRARLARLGVTVVTAKPGFVRTPMMESEPLPGMIPVLEPADAASQILRGAASHKRVVYVPWWWRPVMWAIRTIPDPIFERLKV